MENNIQKYSETEIAVYPEVQPIVYSKDFLIQKISSIENGILEQTEEKAKWETLLAKAVELEVKTLEEING
ncbi:MAG: hypothetical protein ACR2IQ_02655 [Minisyncoccia bacterium]